MLVPWPPFSTRRRDADRPGENLIKIRMRVPLPDLSDVRP